MVKKQGITGISDSIISRWFSEDFISMNIDEIQIYKNMLNATSSEGYIACCEAIKDTDLTNSTHLINKPTLVIVGSNDPNLPFAIYKILLIISSHGAKFCA